MPWLKKNLTLVITGLVAVGLLGFSGYFLYSKMTHANQVYQALIAQQRELDRLNNLNPHPGNAKINNIATAKKQAERLAALLEEAQSEFAPFDFPTNLTSGKFKETLLKTIYDLTRQADRSGVKLGTNFAFSFAGLRNQLSVDSRDIPLLARQLAHVEAISRMLIDARVLTIDGIKRPTLKPPEDTSSDTTGGAFTTPAPNPVLASTTSADETSNDDYWDRRPITNELAVLYPYSFTFHAFTKELADFLQALSSSPHCFMVKNIAVDHASSSLLRKPSRMMGYGVYGAAGMQGGGMDAGMASRYGMATPGGGMDRYGLGMPGMGTGRGPVRRGNKTILLEPSPLRVRAWIYVVTLLPPDQQGMAPPSAAPAPYGGNAPGADRYGIPTPDPTYLR